jgi:acyl carrier protein
MVAAAAGRSGSTMWPDSKLDDLDLDSLQLMEVLLVIETHTGVPLDEDVLLRVTTVGDLYAEYVSAATTSSLSDPSPMA